MNSEVTVVHECGHFIVALSYGWLPDSLTLGDKPNNRAYLPDFEAFLVDYGIRPGVLESIEQVLIQLAGGAAAEIMVFDRVVEGAGEIGTPGADKDVFQRIWVSLPEEAQSKLRIKTFEEAQDRATAILSRDLYRALLEKLPDQLTAENYPASALLELVHSTWREIWVP